MGICLDFVGVTMVLLTTTPIGKLLLDLVSTIQKRNLAILLVLLLTTFTELGRIQIGWWELPTHTWPKVVSEPGLRSFLSSELIPKN